MSHTPPGDEEAPLCADPGCAECAQKRAIAAFHGEPLADSGGAVTCPHCTHSFVPETGAVRATESAPVVEADKPKKKPYGDVEYADPGYQKDGKKRYPLDTDKHIRAAWSYINQEKNAGQYTADQLKKIKARIKAAMKRAGMQVSESSVTEAVINGRRSFDDIRELIRKALRARLSAEPMAGYCWVSIVDISDTDVVYSADYERLWQCTYTLAEDGTAELGEPAEVVRTYAPAGGGESGVETPVETAAVESGQAQRDRIVGRVVEAKGTGADGGRIFRVRIIAYGDSKNNRRYPEAVLRAAAPLYEGAKAFNRHRDDQELASGTIEGLAGYYRDVEAVDDGVEADLRLLPSATHVAEALDATLAAQEDNLAPLVGISHDVYAVFKPVTENGQRLQEAVSIEKVNSADIVSDPAAGGQATRMVAGGVTNPDSKTDPAGTVPVGQQSTKESDVKTSTADVLAALKTATPEQLAEVGLSKVSESTTTPAPQEAKATEATEAAEVSHAKTSFLGNLLIRQKVADAGLPDAVAESVTAGLPDRIRESDVDNHIASLKTALAGLEKAGLAPTVASAEVVKESHDKKIAALDLFFTPNTPGGYKSFKEAYLDITGARPRSIDEDFNRTVLQESIGQHYSSAARSVESVTTSTWAEILGDSITRRMVAEYARPNLAVWRMIVSSIVPVNDFRTQRLDRMGGYGVLPAVNQGAPYQPLTTPGDEEATYAITKRGGTEDLTLEAIANDDVRSISRIPVKLGLAAAQTIYRFVFDFLVNNAATSYDSVALFHSSHANTDNPAVLGQSTLSTARKKMGVQAAYGDSSDVLAIEPKFLVHPAALEEIAFQLSTSAVAIPSTPAGPSDAPNIHQGLIPIKVPYYSDENDWFLIADPSLCPTIEIGFYQGREDPELFTQSDQTVGSMFDADKLTWKIRHIYSGAVVDHRGFYRGAN